MVNRLGRTHIHLDSKRETVPGESIGKAVRDIMRLSSGLEYLEYVDVHECCTTTSTITYVCVFVTVTVFTVTVSVMKEQELLLMV